MLGEATGSFVTPARYHQAGFPKPFAEIAPHAKSTFVLAKYDLGAAIEIKPIATCYTASLFGRHIVSFNIFPQTSQPESPLHSLTTRILDDTLFS